MIFGKPPHSTNQEGNDVAGDQAGRDVNKPTIIYNPPAERLSFIQVLNARYKAEQETYPDIVGALQHYLNRVDASPVLGIYYKLNAAGWDHDEISRAAELKELFAKKLRHHMLSEVAQHIIAHVLARVFNAFESAIRPLIASNASAEQIRAAVTERVIEPAFNELEENVLMLHLPEILGALYYLTGNCHVKWHRGE